jgi:hypothetical protein
MEKKSEFQVAFEGFSLIVIGIFVILFHVLKLIPESDALVFHNITFFDLLQLGLKAVVVILSWLHYKDLIRQVSRSYILNCEVYPETQSDLKLLISFLNFFSLAFVYELFVPGLKYVLLKFNENLFFVILILEIFFTLIGVLLLIKTWNAYQALVADMSVEKHKPKLEEQENLNSNTIETDSDGSKNQA